MLFPHPLSATIRLRRRPPTVRGPGVFDPRGPAQGVLPGNVRLAISHVEKCSLIRGQVAGFTGWNLLRPFIRTSVSPSETMGCSSGCDRHRAGHTRGSQAATGRTPIRRGITNKPGRCRPTMGRYRPGVSRSIGSGYAWVEGSTRATRSTICGSRASKARARCEIVFFSSAECSARVRSEPVGWKIGS